MTNPAEKSHRAALKRYLSVRHLAAADAAKVLGVTRAHVVTYRRQHPEAGHQPRLSGVSATHAAPVPTWPSGSTRSVTFGGESHHINRVTLVAEPFAVPGEVSLAPQRREDVE